MSVRSKCFRNIEHYCCIRSIQFIRLFSKSTMIKLMLRPVWTGNRFPLSTLSETARLLHHKSAIFKSNLRYTNILQYHQCRGKKDDTKVTTLFKPVPVESGNDEINIGAELTGKLDKGEMLKILNAFTQKPQIRLICAEHGLDATLQQQTFGSFRRYCIDAENLPADLHIVISDILQGAGHPDDILPYFLRYARQMFPHLDCMEDLKQISDLRRPANWYPGARAKARKIIFHAGPTNSGKTYHAMTSFMKAKSGVYCGPLKLLATEVFNKCNTLGTPCDLVTGEERRFGNANGTPSTHVACTVEMTSISTPYEVAVIDEIQLLKDPGRGWAWTRAFLGLIADEVHVCGEAGTVSLLERLCETTGEAVEVREYKRLTKLTVEDRALGSLDNVEPGDCIVCFNKNDIYSVSRQIESSGKEVAVIYGGLPPGTKLAQAAKFNDPENSCKVMVATDAIGMGLNLSIRRIIFYSLKKPTTNENGEREINVISISSALQIAGRAGRFGTQWENGFVTVYQPDDLSTLKELLSQPPEPIVQAGLHPTADQIELYAYHLPDSTLSNLMDIFVSLSTVDDSLYFMCNIDDFKFLAEMIQHVPLALRSRYVFCCAPINRKMPFVCAMFLKFARQFSKNEAITFDFVASNCGWPFKLPKTIAELMQLETVFDVMDLYLWLSYRFPDLFPNGALIRETQKDIDYLIQQGVFQITKLLKNAENVSMNKTAVDSPVTISKKSARSTKAMREAENVVENLKRIKVVKNSIQRSGGRLSDQLLEKGLVTQDMLDTLRKEWSGQSNNSTDNIDDEYSDKNGKKAKKGKNSMSLTDEIYVDKKGKKVSRRKKKF